MHSTHTQITDRERTKERMSERGNLYVIGRACLCGWMKCFRFHMYTRANIHGTNNGTELPSILIIICRRAEQANSHWPRHCHSRWDTEQDKRKTNKNVSRKSKRIYCLHVLAERHDVRTLSLSLSSDSTPPLESRKKKKKNKMLRRTRKKPPEKKTNRWKLLCICMWYVCVSITLASMSHCTAQYGLTKSAYNITTSGVGAGRALFLLHAFSFLYSISNPNGSHRQAKKNDFIEKYCVQ